MKSVTETWNCRLRISVNLNRVGETQEESSPSGLHKYWTSPLKKYGPVRKDDGREVWFSADTWLNLPISP